MANQRYGRGRRTENVRISKPGRKGKLEAERKADEWLESGDTDRMRLSDAWERFIAYKKTTCGTAWVVKLDSLYRDMDSAGAICEALGAHNAG